MAPEAEVLLCCTRTRLDSKTSDRLCILLQQTLNWDHLLDLARRHGVLPLLYWSLNQTCPTAVPDDTMTQLREQFHHNARRSLFLSAELVRLLTLFESENIPVIPFKGPVLATSVYGDLSLRQFSDLDILVREQDINRAKALFLSQGYQMKIECIRLSKAQEAEFVKSPHIHKLVRECAYPFINHKIGIMTELHWRVMPKFFSFRIDSEELWQNLESVMLAGKSIPNLSPENTLLLLCGHGTKDCWIQLNRICDIAELIRSHPQLNWQNVIDKASQLGGERMLLLSLFLAQELLEISLPDWVQQRIKADPNVKTLGIQIQAELFEKTKKKPSIGRLSLFHLEVRERLQDKIQYCLRVAIDPTTSDWLLLPDIKVPTFLYYLIRPIRLVTHKVTKG